MGYYADMMYSSVLIHKTNYDACLDAIVTAFPDELTDPITYLSDALYYLGFETTENDDGLTIDYYLREKYYDTDDVLETIAPFVKEGSAILFVGEDMTLWGFFYKNKTVHFRVFDPELLVNLAWHLDANPDSPLLKY